MVKTVPGKRDTRKIDPQKYQHFIENLRMFCRHKYRKQSQGISDHIIVQRRQDIRSVSDIHIPHGDCRIMIYKYGFQDISQNSRRNTPGRSDAGERRHGSISVIFRSGKNAGTGSAPVLRIPAYIPHKNFFFLYLIRIFYS